jgi:RNA polymerase sigma factor (TIGR02999 family)
MTEHPLPAGGHATFDGAVYAELKRIASHHLRTHGAQATLCTTDLVHEAYLKFRGGEAQGWESRAHFFGSASRAMRQVLVDYARHRGAAKRGDGEPMLTLTGNDAALEVQLDELLVLDEALEGLRRLDERLCRVVELRFFAGLTDEEIGELLSVSTRTVGRDWLKARMYLARELGHG